MYRYAADRLDTDGNPAVLDIGCGYALKLKEFIQPLTPNITGLDEQHAISYCNEAHSFGTWLEADIESPETHIGGPFDMIISADVIEHLADPDTLLELIRANCHEHTQVVLSTPERDLRRGPDDMGPPGNPAHIREWNEIEFAQYLQDRGFEIQDHQIMNLREGMPTCQTVLCRPVAA